MEVRSGKGLQPLYSGRVPLGTRTARRGEFRQIIDQCRSEVGTEKRRNAEGMRNKLPNAWAPSGSSVIAIDAFLAESLQV
jgi:hypothetical protein